MKYVIETTDDGCVETVTLDDGKEYSKRHVRTDYGSISDDFDFWEQMKRDNTCDEILDRVNDLFDGFFASNFMALAEWYK